MKIHGGWDFTHFTSYNGDNFMPVVISASSAPTGTDDSAAGYYQGYHWIKEDTDDVYECVDDTPTSAVWVNLTGGVSTFLDLTDVDTVSYASKGGWLVRVNAGETGLEVVDGTTLYASAVHGSAHTLGGGDEIDGDKLGITWNPSNYTPGIIPTETDNVDQLTAHLYGIDQALAGVGGVGGSDTELLYNNAGAEDGVAELTYNNSTGLVSYAPILDEATGDEIGFDLSGTVNKATSGNYTLLKLAVTETAAPGTDNRILDMTAAGSSVAYFSAVGNLNLNPSDTTGDGTRIYFGTDDYIEKGTSEKIKVHVAGTDMFDFTTTSFSSVLSSGGRIAQISASFLVPQFTRGNDFDTGLGFNGSNGASIISNSKHGVVVTDAGATVNVQLFASDGDFGGTISGEGILKIQPATTTPTGTLSAGGIVYVTGNDIRYLAANGSDSSMIAAGGGGSVADTWVDVTATSATLTVNTTHGVDNASLVTLTLPVSATKGDEIVIVGIGAGGWKVAQNASQRIIFGDRTTTTGVTGEVTINHERDCITMRCIVNNNEWQVVSSIGKKFDVT